MKGTINIYMFYTYNVNIKEYYTSLFKLYERVYTLRIHIVDKYMGKNDNFLTRHSPSNDNIENIYAYHADEGH